MPWVKFVSDFDWKPSPMTLRAFLPGMVKNVPTPCADAAVQAGAGVRMKKPHKKAVPSEDQGKV